LAGIPRSAKCSTAVEGWPRALVSRTRCSVSAANGAISAFTRVFDALWLIRDPGCYPRKERNRGPGSAAHHSASLRAALRPGHEGLLNETARHPADTRSHRRRSAFPTRFAPRVWPQPRGTGTQPMTVQAICCVGAALTRFLALAAAAGDAASDSAAASATSFAVGTYYRDRQRPDRMAKPRSIRVPAGRADR
jgi:hypothetical protein